MLSLAECILHLFDSPPAASGRPIQLSTSWSMDLSCWLDWATISRQTKVCHCCAWIIRMANFTSMRSNMTCISQGLAQSRPYSMRLYMHGEISCQCVTGPCLWGSWVWMQSKLLFRQEEEEGFHSLYSYCQMAWARSTYTYIPFYDMTLVKVKLVQVSVYNCVTHSLHHICNMFPAS